MYEQEVIITKMEYPKEFTTRKRSISPNRISIITIDSDDDFQEPKQKIQKVSAQPLTTPTLVSKLLMPL